MNEGIITKIFSSKNNKKQETLCNIRLDRNVKIDEIEYNIYVDANNKKSYLFKTDTKVKIGFQGVIVGLSNKYSFELDFTNYNPDSLTGYINITAVSYGK